MRIGGDLAYEGYVAEAGSGYGRGQLSAICAVLVDGRELAAVVLGYGRGGLRAEAADLAHGNGAAGSRVAIAVEALINGRGNRGAVAERLADVGGVAAPVLERAGRVALSESRTGRKSEDRSGGDKQLFDLILQNLVFCMHGLSPSLPARMQPAAPPCISPSPHRGEGIREPRARQPFVGRPRFTGWEALLSAG